MLRMTELDVMGFRTCGGIAIVVMWDILLFFLFSFELLVLASPSY
jgi:hypothetical protein